GQLATPWCMTLEALPRPGQAPEWRVVVADTLNHRLCRWRVDQIVKAGAVPSAPPVVTAGGGKA
ncbi:MAG TPA: hypothetical protein VL860_05500, partial [Planctomycetota bacterium]|nr:hypothetical protein [Planctomycetota bacterium]